MDVCAELTLRLIRACQEALHPRSSGIDWVFLPQHKHTSWTEARELLSGVAKPILVAPLLESGWLTLWSLSALASGQRAVFEREFANQRQYFSEKLVMLSLKDDDHVETPDTDFTLTAGEFRRWIEDYALAVGLGMSASPNARTARLLIRPPGGGKPVGWVESRLLAAEPGC